MSDLAEIARAIRFLGEAVAVAGAVIAVAILIGIGPRNK
jgi:hypothetical protein